MNFLDIKDSEGNVVPDTELADYQIELVHVHDQVKVFDLVDLGTSNYEQLFFVPIAIIGDSANSTDVVIKLSGMSDNGNPIMVPDVSLTFQRGKIFNEANNGTLSITDAVAGLQYLANLLEAGQDLGQVNVINMASILPPQVGATGIKPSVKDVIALMQKLVGLRNDSFQLVAD